MAAAGPMPRWLHWLLVMLALYGGVALLARLLAGRALYHPDLASRRVPQGAQVLTGAGGDDVAVWHLPNPQARCTLWFFHGNAEDLGDLEPALRACRDAGFAVYAHDYSGYGVSGGKPSEAALYESSRRARAHLRGPLGVAPAQTILYGRSLGGGPAVQMAREEPVAGLVLQSAFTSAYRVVTQRRVLPFDLFENERKLPRLTMPVLVMHGQQDEVIPFQHGEALYAAAGGPKRALWVPGASHNDLAEAAGPRYWTALREFAAVCTAAAPATR